MFPLSVLVSYFNPPLPPSIFVDLYRLIQFTIGIWCKSLPRMLVMCLSNLLWWQYFLYSKKEYCGLLGGLTFYRTCHICKSGEKKNTKNTKMNIFPFLHRACTNTNYVQKGPFLWARYSSLQLHNFFLVHTFGRLSFRGFLRRLYWVNLSVAWEKAGKFWSRAAWCRLCVLTHVGSCVPNYQAKSDKKQHLQAGIVAAW